MSPDNVQLIRIEYKYPDGSLHDLPMWQMPGPGFVDSHDVPEDEPEF